MYNKNYIIKNVGYFQNYVYKYKNYLLCHFYFQAVNVVSQQIERSFQF